MKCGVEQNAFHMTPEGSNIQFMYHYDVFDGLLNPIRGSSMVWFLKHPVFHTGLHIHPHSWIN